jgi:hypothetical protein
MTASAVHARGVPAGPGPRAFEFGLRGRTDPVDHINDGKRPPGLAESYRGIVNVNLVSSTVEFTSILPPCA